MKDANLNIRISKDTLDKLNMVAMATCLSKTTIITNMIEDLYDLWEETTIEAVKTIKFNYETEPNITEHTLDDLIDYYCEQNMYDYSKELLKAIIEDTLKGSNIIKEQIDSEALAYTE